MAIALILNAKKGMSIYQLQRDLNLNQKTAWYILTRIRAEMANKTNPIVLQGIIEADETYIGGKPRKENKKEDRKPAKRGRGTSKTTVIGAVERGGEVVAQVVENLTGRTILLYCHRKFRPLSNIRLCYNDNPFERRIPMAKRRRFTAKFKAEVVLEALCGESSQAELCRHHNLSENQVSTWKRQLLENVETFFESADKQSSESAERIVQLEQLVGRLTLALEIQKKASTLLD